jgi:hypothetical protein
MRLLLNVNQVAKIAIIGHEFTFFAVRNGKHLSIFSALGVVNRDDVNIMSLRFHRGA